MELQGLHLPMHGTVTNICSLISWQMLNYRITAIVCESLKIRVAPGKSLSELRARLIGLKS